MGVFTDTAELVDLSMHMMRILAVGYIAMAVTQSLSGVMRGAGDTVTPMWISLILLQLFFVFLWLMALLLPYKRSEADPTGRPESTFIFPYWYLGQLEQL